MKLILNLDMFIMLKLLLPFLFLILPPSYAKNEEGVYEVALVHSIIFEHIPFWIGTSQTRQVALINYNVADFIVIDEQCGRQRGNCPRLCRNPNCWFL